MRRIACALTVALITVISGNFGCYNEQGDQDGSCDPLVAFSVNTGFSVYCDGGLIGSSPGNGTVDNICRSASGTVFRVEVTAAAEFEVWDAFGRPFNVIFRIEGSTQSTLADRFSVSGPCTVIITVP